MRSCRSPSTAAGPHWSPDGSKIVFGNLDTASAAIGHNIQVVNADGSGLASLTDETSPSGDGGPTWSPDGTRITFTQYHAGEHFVSVVVMNADGSDPVVIWHPISGTDNFPGSPGVGHGTLNRPSARRLHRRDRRSREPGLGRLGRAGRTDWSGRGAPEARHAAVLGRSSAPGPVRR